MQYSTICQAFKFERVSNTGSTVSGYNFTSTLVVVITKSDKEVNHRQFWQD